jgi:hypothetical protein
MDRLANTIQKIATDNNPAKSKVESFYFCLLSDVKGVTVTSGKTGLARQSGFIRLQCYSQVKNNLDAHKYLPFAEDERFSEILILNSEEQKKLKSRGYQFDIVNCRTCFLRNLARIDSGYGSSLTLNKSRLEFRMSLALYGEMLNQLESENWPLVNPLQTAGSKPYFVFETVNLNTYVSDRVHTIARFFQEIISTPEEPTPAQQKLARIMMKLLKSAVCSYPIERATILWKSKYRPKISAINAAEGLPKEGELNTDNDDNGHSTTELGQEKKGLSIKSRC